MYAYTLEWRAAMNRFEPYFVEKKIDINVLVQWRPSLVELCFSVTQAKHRS